MKSQTPVSAPPNWGLPRWGEAGPQGVSSIPAQLGQLYRKKDKAPPPGTSSQGYPAHLTSCHWYWAPAGHAKGPWRLVLGGGPNSTLYGVLLYLMSGTSFRIWHKQQLARHTRQSRELALGSDLALYVVLPYPPLGTSPWGCLVHLASCC